MDISFGDCRSSPLQVTEMDIPDVRLIEFDVPVVDVDVAWETYNYDKLVEQGISTHFVEAHSFVLPAARTLSGLHFQIAPHAQERLINVNCGRIFGVAADIRRDSQDFGKHVTFEISSQQNRAVFVPVGFAVGFCTLEPFTQVEYKCSDHIYPELCRGISWADPALNIRWPTPERLTVLPMINLRELKLERSGKRFPWEINA